MSGQEKPPAPPPGYRYGGTYRPTLMNFVQAAYYIVLGRPRSLARDGLLALRHAPAPPLVRGQDRIPEQGRIVVAANHYERPGLWMAWPAVYLSHVVQQRTGRDTRWIAIQEWESFSIRGVPVPPGVTRAVFERAFRAYGILAMPPPDAPAAARAATMRAAAKVVRSGGIIGIMPEATVGPTPELLVPPPGVGEFLLLLTATGADVLPVGLFEENDRLIVNIGVPFRVAISSGSPRTARDRQASERVMTAIRDLLPEPLWGAYDGHERSAAPH